MSLNSAQSFSISHHHHCHQHHHLKPPRRFQARAMGRAVAVPPPLWTSLLTTLVMLSVTNVTGLGVNWGALSSHPMKPDIVVQLLKDNGFDEVKLFEADSWSVSALAGSGIKVMLGIPNNRLAELAKDNDACEDWVKENVTAHMKPNGVDIRWVAVGNEAFLTSYNGTFVPLTLPAMKNIQKALNKAGFKGKIKVTTPMNADVYESKSVPSDGDFRADIKDVMLDIVQFLKENDSPFLVNIYPFLSLYQNPDFPFNFSFFDGATPVQDKNNVQYTNVFDANYDTLIWSLKKAGAGDLHVVVSEVGWPTDADKQANVRLAQKFYDGLFKKLEKDKGTPLRPGILDIYLFSLFDEDQKSIAPGLFERHWGIFRYDGRPKFPMALPGRQGTNNSNSGNVQDRMPVAAKNVQYLPYQWCQYTGKQSDRIPAMLDWACSVVDCTSLVYGSTCNNLDSNGNISYVYNMYYQTQDQDVRACDFEGTGKIVKKNLSTGSCLFPIQIISSANRLSSAGLFVALGLFLLALF